MEIVTIMKKHLGIKKIPRNFDFIVYFYYAKNRLCFKIASKIHTEKFNMYYKLYNHNL